MSHIMAFNYDTICDEGDWICYNMRDTMSTEYIRAVTAYRAWREYRSTCEDRGSYDWDTEETRGWEPPTGLYQHAIQIVLTVQQDEKIGKFITGAGYDEVCRFLNDNSGNECIMYVYNKGFKV